MKLNVELEEHVTRIISKESGIRIGIYGEAEKPIVKHPGIGILIFKEKIKNIFLVETGLDIKGHQWDKLILVAIPASLEARYVLRGFINQALENRVKLPVHLKEENIPSNMQKLVMEFVKQQIFIINHFGTDHLLVKAPKKVSAKVQHRWNKKVSGIPFYVETPDSKAEIQWVKRNEMVIKVGATMKKDVPLNKDGSLGFAAKMGQKVRDDHHQSFKDFKTTADITLKSVNEVSLFLYFAGTNSWLVFKDADGKTIDAWTRVD
jgi:hypothetical protein